MFSGFCLCFVWFCLEVLEFLALFFLQQVWASFSSPTTRLLAFAWQVKEPAWQKDAWAKQVPDKEEFEDMAMKKFGMRPRPSFFTKVMKYFLVPVVALPSCFILFY